MSIKLVVDRITPELERRKRLLRTVMPKAYDYFRSQTPIRTGIARRSTKLIGKTIHAAYPYAQRLDEGYSRQSPEGMTKPTEQFVQDLVTKIITGK